MEQYQRQAKDSRRQVFGKLYSRIFRTLSLLHLPRVCEEYYRQIYPNRKWRVFLIPLYFQSPHNVRILHIPKSEVLIPNTVFYLLTNHACFSTSQVLARVQIQVSTLFFSLPPSSPLSKKLLTFDFLFFYFSQHQ